PGFHEIEVGLSTRDGGVPTVASPASVAAGGGGCDLRCLLALSECFQEFRPRPEKSDPAPQHPRNLRNRMLRHLACQHSGGDGLQPGVMAGLKESLPLRMAVPDQRLPTTA